MSSNVGSVIVEGFPQEKEAIPEELGGQQASSVVETNIFFENEVAQDNVGYDNCIQNRPRDWHRPAKAQGPKAKSTSGISVAQSEQSEEQNEIKNGQQLTLPRTPSRGSGILKLCI
jgi:hypothetical protein